LAMFQEIFVPQPEHPNIEDVWFQKDVTPAHFAVPFREYLKGCSWQTDRDKLFFLVFR
jgi:hypothetical protein